MNGKENELKDVPRSVLADLFCGNMLASAIVCIKSKMVNFFLEWAVWICECLWIAYFGHGFDDNGVFSRVFLN